MTFVDGTKQLYILWTKNDIDSLKGGGKQLTFEVKMALGSWIFPMETFHL